MPKLRVYQLARELNRDNDEIIRELQHMGVPVTSHSNTVEDRLADSLRKKLGVFEEPKAAPAPPPPVEEVIVEVPKVAAEVTVAKVEPKPEPKVEPRVEPKIEEKPVEKVAAPPV